MPLIDTPLFILCGGKGARLGAQTANTPKSLVPVSGEPFLAHQLRLLEKAGFHKITLCTGHLGEQIEDFIHQYKNEKQQLQSTHATQIACLPDPPGLAGTGGALARACKSSAGTICFTYGDSYLDIDFAAVLNVFRERNARALLTVIDKARAGHHPANIAMERDFITLYAKNSSLPKVRYIDYGFTVLSCELLQDFAHRDAFDLGELFSHLASKRMLQGLKLTQPFHEIGSPEGLLELEHYLIARSCP